MRPTVEILLVLDFEYSGTRAHGHLAKLIIRAIPDVAFAEVGTEIIWRVDQLLPNFLLYGGKTFGIGRGTLKYVHRRLVANQAKAQ